MAQTIRLSDRQMAARVKRGACLLDKHRPGWEREIDLGRLGLLENDVLSQLCGDPMSALQTLGFGSVRDRLEQLYTEIPATTFRDGNLADYGFAAFREDGGGDWRQAYQELRRLWRTEVRARLGPSVRRVVGSATELPQGIHGPL
jgi:hypothetical protein